MYLNVNHFLIPYVIVMLVVVHLLFVYQVDQFLLIIQHLLLEENDFAKENRKNK